VTALGALANGSRLSVFRHLIALGPEGAFPGDVAQTFDLPAATLSFHLKTLLHAGLVEAEQQGRNIRYRANFAQMQDLVDFLTRNCCGGDLSRCVPAAGKRTKAERMPARSARSR
jgi:DNA-binding transcriptional ArsR family regulator